MWPGKPLVLHLFESFRIILLAAICSKLHSVGLEAFRAHESPVASEGQAPIYKEPHLG